MDYIQEKSEILLETVKVNNEVEKFLSHLTKFQVLFYCFLRHNLNKPNIWGLLWVLNSQNSTA